MPRKMVIRPQAAPNTAAIGAAAMAVSRKRAAPGMPLDERTRPMSRIASATRLVSTRPSSTSFTTGAASRNIRITVSLGRAWAARAAVMAEFLLLVIGSIRTTSVV